MKKYFLLSFLVFNLSIAPVFATSLYLDTENNEIGPGDSIVVDVKIDARDCINVLKTEINFPNDDLELLEFFNGTSILTMWVDSPNSGDIEVANSNGKLVFSGGVPGGYCGEIPGDPGDSNVIASLVFKIPEYGKKENKKEFISLNKDQTELYLNDGFGTMLKEFDLQSLELIFKDTPIITESGDKLEAIIKSDKIRPEPFVIWLRGGDNLFDGLNYVVFNTSDKQTGIDHYEVLEIKPWEKVNIAPKQNIFEKIFKIKKETPQWKEASTPYRLKDQSLSSIIKVKAIDKAGNERMVEYIPDQPIEAEKIEINYIYVLILLILIFILFGYLLLRRISKRNDKY